MISKNFCSINTPIIKLLPVINKLKKKIIVVHKNKKILGTITDGDIRRYFINNSFKNALVNEVMNKKPVFLFNNFKDSDLKKINRNNIRFIPIINKKKQVIDIISHNQLKKKHENEVVIIAGGKGKRLLPYTKRIPKPMLKINNKPHLESLVKQLIQHGFSNINLCLNYKANYIKNYMKKKFKNIKFYTERKPMGTAGPIRNIKFTNKKSIIVLNADLITNLNMTNLIEYHELNKSNFTIGIKKSSYKIPFAKINVKKNYVSNIEEKPEHDYFFNAGIYVLSHKVIKLIPNKFFDMPELIQKCINKQIKISPFYIFENWLDFGDLQTFNLVNKK